MHRRRCRLTSAFCAFPPIIRKAIFKMTSLVISSDEGDIHRTLSNIIKKIETYQTLVLGQLDFAFTFTCNLLHHSRNVSWRDGLASI